MTKLLIEKMIRVQTGELLWKVTAWYGEDCWHVAFMKSLPEAMKLAEEWVEGDAVHNQQGGAK